VSVRRLFSVLNPEIKTLAHS